MHMHHLVKLKLHLYRFVVNFPVIQQIHNKTKQLEFDWSERPHVDTVLNVIDRKSSLLRNVFYKFGKDP